MKPRKGEHRDSSLETGRRRSLLPILALLISFLVLEGSSLLALSLLPRVTGVEVRTTRTILQEQQQLSLRLLESTEIREELDPVLGWLYRPGFSSSEDRVNSVGARSLGEYDRDPPEGTLRVVAYGDSFMYGNEVSVQEAWSTVLEDLVPNVEVLNFGVGGYGTDQAFLRYLGTQGVHGEDLVLIGFAPVNLRRTVNVYRRFISNRDWPLVKPRFAIEDEGLVLIPNPLPTPEEYRQLVEEPLTTVRALGVRDSWYNPLEWENPLYDLSPTVRLVSYLGSRVYRTRLSRDKLLADGGFNPASEAFAVQRELLKAFHDSVSANGRRAQIVIFPDHASIRLHMEGRPTTYAPLVSSLKEEGVQALDLVNIFSEEAAKGGLERLFAPGGHYSSEGNRLVAQAMTSLLP